MTTYTAQCGCDIEHADPTKDEAVRPHHGDIQCPVHGWTRVVARG